MKASLVTIAATLAVTNGMNGEEACENRGLDREQCAAVGCCNWSPDLGECMSNVGQDMCKDDMKEDMPEMKEDMPAGMPDKRMRKMGREGRKGRKGRKDRKGKMPMDGMNAVDRAINHGKGMMPGMMGDGNGSGSGGNGHPMTTTVTGEDYCESEMMIMNEAGCKASSCCHWNTDEPGEASFNGAGRCWSDIGQDTCEDAKMMDDGSKMGKKPMMPMDGMKGKKPMMPMDGMKGKKPMMPMDGMHGKKPMMPKMPMDGMNAVDRAINHGKNKGKMMPGMMADPEVAGMMAHAGHHMDDYKHMDDDHHHHMDKDLVEKATKMMDTLKKQKMQPNHEYLKDLARLTEEWMMGNEEYNVDAIMEMTGMSYEQLSEYAFDIVTDMVVSMSNEDFLKLQLEISTERIGDMDMYMDGEMRRAEGPSATSIVEDLKKIQDAGSRRRMFGQQQGGRRGGQRQQGGFGGQQGGFGGQQGGFGGQQGGNGGKPHWGQWVQIAGAGLGSILNTVGQIGQLF